MKKENKIEKKKDYSWLYYLLMFAVVVLISYFFPYTHDDWGWGTSEGMARLNSLFADYNGRWAGNILEMIITRSRIIRTIVISMSFLLIVYFIRKIVADKKGVSLLSIILLFAMPVAVLAQGVAWTAGFANYVPPVVIVLMFIFFNKNVFNEDSVEIKKRWIVPFLLLGFVGSLFIEHMTIYNVVLSVLLVLYLFIKKKKIILADLFYMIGSVAGAILMFSNSAYYNIANDIDGYRTIEQGNVIVRALKTYFEELYKFLVHDNTFLNIVLCILLLAIVYQFYKSNKESIKKVSNAILQFATLIISGYLSYIIYTKVVGGANIFIYPTYQKYLEGLMMIVFAIAIVCVTFVVIENKEKRSRILFEIGSIIFMALPLLIVTPIGPRCFVPTYVMFVLLTCEFFNILVEEDNNLLNKGMIIVSVFLSICTLSIYGYLFKVDNERILYINNHNDDAVIVLPKIPLENYMQVPNPRSGEFKNRFKEFYGINEKTELEFIDYIKWKKALEDNA